MKVEYKSRSIEKVCEDASVAERKYGREMAEKIQLRIDQIRAADSVEMMIQFKIGRCHRYIKTVKINMQLIWYIHSDWYSKRKETKFKSQTLLK